MKYHVVHKLTKQPIRSTAAPYSILVFDQDEALRICEMKNKISGADFYKVEVIQ